MSKFPHLHVCAPVPSDILVGSQCKYLARVKKVELMRKLHLKSLFTVKLTKRSRASDWLHSFHA